MDMILKNTFQSISPAYELIGDVTVGSNTTQVDFTGLNIGKDDELLLVSDGVGTATSTLNVYINNNTVESNYYFQYLYANGTGTGSGRATGSAMVTVNSGNKAQCFSKMKLSNNGCFLLYSDAIRRYDTSSMFLESISSSSTFTSSNISKISLVSVSLPNAIGTGSRFQLYKLVAEKVADIIVPSNTTSVDITGLNIGKDGEYYLVSDFISPSVGASSFYIYANNDLVNTNYYIQNIFANSTSVGGGRNNVPYFTGVGNGNKTLSSTDIKLTNSGYFTFQSSNIREYGGSVVQLSKHYGSNISTLSEITSISIYSSNANGIGANSRFTLYKMK